MCANTLLTFAQFEALPDKSGRQELLHGRVIETPPPRSSHQPGLFTKLSGRV